MISSRKRLKISENTLKQQEDLSKNMSSKDHGSGGADLTLESASNWGRAWFIL